MKGFIAVVFVVFVVVSSLAAQTFRARIDTVQVTVSGKAIGLAPIPISNEERSNDTLTVEFPNIPLTYDEATVQVVFQTESGYPIAHSAQTGRNVSAYGSTNSRPACCSGP